ncbi:MAG TPA: PPC domain-containing protein, partial [Gemmataceae bacterium]|nr:PPC domain-containing protein [Gemmataceae bacterium]
VYDAAQQLLTFNDDGGGGSNDTDSLVRFNVTAGQTYYVQAGAFGDSTGAYVLTFTAGDRLGDGFGHTFADAQAIPLDATGAGSVQGTIVNSGDQDFFRFTAPATGLLSVTQGAASGGSLDSVLSVYDATPQHAQLARNDDASSDTVDSALQLAVTAGQTYYVVAAGFGTSTGAFRVTIAPVASDDYGSDFATATDITPSLAPDGSGTVMGAVEAPGSVDFLQFTAAVTGTLTIEQDAAAGNSLDSTLTVYDAAQNQIAFNDDIDTAAGNYNSRVQIDVVAGQTYYVAAAAFGDGTGAYTLVITPGTVGAGGAVPGGTIDTAVPVALDASGSATVSGTITAAQGAFFFRFTAPADGRMLAEQDAAPGSSLDSYLYVFNGAGQQIAGDDDGAGGLNSLAEFPVVAGQIYTVEASAFDGSTGAFTLTLAPAASRLRHTFADALDLLPQADSPASASAAGFADTIGSITTADDVNFFQFTAPFTGGVEVRLQALPGSGLDGLLFAFDNQLAPDGTAQHNLLAHDRGGDVVLPLAVQKGQTYFVEAAGAAGSTGDYALSLTPVPDDFGNDFNHAETLQLDATDAGSQAGSVEVPGDVDLFRFVAPTSGLLTVTLGPTGDSALAPVLSAFDSSQQPIALQTGTAAGQAVQVQFAVTAGQTYYVEASGFGISTGAYTLSLHDPVDFVLTGAHDFASAQPLSLTFGPDGTAAEQVFGPLAAGEVQFFRFNAPVTGPLAIASPGADAALDVFTFPDGFQGDAQQVTGDAQNAFVERAGQTYFVRVTARQASPNGYELTFAQLELRQVEPPDAPPVEPRVGNDTAGDLAHSFTTLRIHGNADPQQTADAISNSLVQTFRASLASRGESVTTNYLLLWLDPVDFVVTDPHGRQAGNGVAANGTPDRVAINQVPGSFASNGGSTGVLQLLILPGALASDYQLSLIGVGDGQVLAGARLITPNGVLSPRNSLVSTLQPGQALEHVLDFSPLPSPVVPGPSPTVAVAQAGPDAGTPSVPTAAQVASSPVSLSSAVAAMLVNATVVTVAPPA